MRLAYTVTSSDPLVSCAIVNVQILEGYRYRSGQDVASPGEDPLPEERLLRA